MSLQKFKNPRVNHQYKKPACHTDYCFERRACCNNYRCCVCQCCLEDFAVYDKVRDSCVGSVTKPDKTEAIPTKGIAATRNGTTFKQNVAEATTTTTSKPPKISKEQKYTKATTTKETPVKRDLGTKVFKSSSGVKYEVKPTGTSSIQSTTKIFKSHKAKGSSGQRQQQDDKTSTIAGVAVALALVAIVAIIVVVVVCSKKKKRRRKMADPLKTKCSVDENGVVTIPLTIDNVADDSCRDTEDATTSDTTIDSPINPVPDKPRVENSRGLGNNHLSPNHPMKGPKSANRKHRKSRDGKCKTQAEQKPLCKAPEERCNGEIQRDEIAREIESTGLKLKNGNAVLYEREQSYKVNSHTAGYNESEDEQRRLNQNEDTLFNGNTNIQVYVHSDGIRRNSLTNNPT